MNIRILVIDDEVALCEILQYNLSKEGYIVDCAYSAEEALEMDLTKYQLFIVDIMMERLSGYDFAKQVRARADLETKPFIFCSALTGEDDTVMGLNIGADDYITKPFVISEVLARVRAVLRRARIVAPKAVNTDDNGGYESDVIFKNIRINRNAKCCYVNGEDAGLTKTEFSILLFFLTHPNRIYSREEIIRQVWSGDVIVTNRTIDTNITRLRKKIGEYGNNIVTRLGFGYGFKEE